jgi:hypothetical protein
MARGWPKSEVELARPFVAYLRDMKWEVYQEVSCGRSDKRADIVATQGPLVWVIECKCSMSLALLDQAVHWLPHAHLVSVCTPYIHRSWHNSRAAITLLRHTGIGWTQIQHVGDEHEFRPMVESVLHRTARPRTLVDSLTEQHKTYAEAGNNKGKFWSPFKETAQNVTSYVKANPGCSLKEMMSKISTHYRSPVSAKSILSNWLRRGVIQGVEYRKEGRGVKLYPKP